MQNENIRKPRSRKAAPKVGGSRRAVAKKAPESKPKTASRAKPVRRRTAGPKNANPLKIIPLGGLSEIGKNMTAIEYGNDIIVIDCGTIFPEGDMLGIDYVIPDYTYLQKNHQKIRGLIVTHGHEDHIGAIPYILKDLKMPIYSATLTLALIQYKLDEHHIKGIHMETVTPGSKIKLGCFEIQFLRVCHSIADAMALAIRTPIGTVVHTGDFKIDHTPLDGQKMDLSAFAKLGKEGVLLLMSDSTNSDSPGYTMSEQRVSRTFEECFDRANGRIIVATFSSNINRIQQIIYIAEQRGRKVFFAGRSLEKVATIAMELGYLKLKKGTLVDDRRLDALEPDQVVIITTGSQGEPMSGLVRMASDEHRTVKLRAGDTVIISASPIPGNEKNVTNVIDKLYQKGAEVIYNGIREVHVSGHAKQEEQKLMLALTNPKFFMPVHGEYHHLKHHAQTALAQGIPQNHIVLANIGDVVELTKNSIKTNGQVPSGSIFVDGSGIGDVGNIVIRDRRILSEEGLVIAVAVVKKTNGALVAGPDIISRGFVYVRENEAMMEHCREIVTKVVKTFENQYEAGDFGAMKNAIRSELRNYLYNMTMRNPMILPIITEVE